MVERLDPDHLAFAASDGRVLCTFNVGDFAALHAAYLTEGRQHAGILLVQQQRYSTGELIRRLLRFASGLSANEMVNRAEYLSAWEPAE